MINKKLTIGIIIIVLFDISVAIYIKNYTLAFVIVGLGTIAWIELTIYAKLFHFFFERYKQRVK